MVMNRHFIKRLISTETGSTAIEYGLIVALVGIVAVTALKTMAGTVVSSFNNTSSSISDVMATD